MDLKAGNLIKRVLSYARGEIGRKRSELPPSPPALPASAPPPTGAVADGLVATSASAVPSQGPEVRGLEVAHRPDGGALILRWSITEAEVARAGALVDGNAVLCLRVVSFSRGRDDVLREVQDRPGIPLVGECEIGEPPQRAIVSLGVRVGDRFVSIAHHVI